MSEKRPQKAPKSPKACTICTNAPKPSTGRILGCVAQTRIARALSPCANLQVFGSSSIRIAQQATQTPVRTIGYLLEPEGSPTRARSGSTWVPGAKTIIFSKVVPTPFGMLKKMFLGWFQPLLASFGRWNVPNALKVGRFKTKNGPKMGQKCVFPNVILDHLGCSNKCF